MTSRSRARVFSAAAITRAVAGPAAMLAVLGANDCSGSSKGPSVTAEPTSSSSALSATPAPSATPTLVSKVEIVPPIVYAAPNSTFEVLAIARTSDGVPLVNPGGRLWGQVSPTSKGGQTCGGW